MRASPPYKLGYIYGCKWIWQEMALHRPCSCVQFQVAVPSTLSPLTKNLITALGVNTWGQAGEEDKMGQTGIIRMDIRPTRCFEPDVQCPVVHALFPVLPLLPDDPHHPSRTVYNQANRLEDHLR